MLLKFDNEERHRKSFHTSANLEFRNKKLLNFASVDQAFVDKKHTLLHEINASNQRMRRKLTLSLINANNNVGL